MEFDPFSDVFFNDPYPTYRALRDESPVYHNREQSFYALSRYEDVLMATLKPLLFSSAEGVEVQGRDKSELGVLPMIISMDPPKQIRQRKLVSMAFTPKTIAVLEDRIRECVGEFLDPLLERGEGDFVKEFTSCVPADVISLLLGVPKSERQRLRELVETEPPLEPGTTTVGAKGKGAAMSRVQYFIELVMTRRASPEMDMISALIAAEIKNDDGEMDQLSDIEIVGFCMLLQAAGAETATKLMSNTLLLLQRNPESLRRVRADHSLLPGAIEEALRFWPPAQILGRQATEEITMHGVTIPKDARVMLLAGSASRDERQFDKPDDYDIDREINIQLAFGHGVHKCIGAALARLETRVALEEVLGRAESYEMDESRTERVKMINVAGYSSIPIRFS